MLLYYFLLLLLLSGYVSAGQTISKFECQMNTRTQAQQPLHTLTHNYTYADHRIRRYFRRLATRSDGVSNGEWAAAVVKLAVLYDIWKTEYGARVFPTPSAVAAATTAAHEKRKALRQGRELFTFLSRLLLLCPSNLYARPQFVLSHCSVILPTGRRRALSRVFNEYFWVAAAAAAVRCLSLDSDENTGASR